MAERTAKEVLEVARSGKRPIIKQIAIRNGYSVNSANTNRPQNTKTYKAIVKPVIFQLEQSRQKAINRLDKKINKAQYHHLVSAIDTFTKNIQLLSGHATENVSLIALLTSAKAIQLPAKTIQTQP